MLVLLSLYKCIVINSFNLSLNWKCNVRTRECNLSFNTDLLSHLSIADRMITHTVFYSFVESCNHVESCIRSEGSA